MRLAVLAACLLAASDITVEAQLVDWGSKSTLLEIRMSIAAVTSVIGYSPNKVEMKTCGSETKTGSWPCKIFTFGSSQNYLVVRFYEDNATRHLSVQQALPKLWQRQGLKHKPDSFAESSCEPGELASGELSSPNNSSDRPKSA